MPDEIEMQKRANYFDLGRDDFMALEEYLLSGLSDRDLGLAEGGLASLPGYNDGGMLLKDRMAKIKSNLASVRFDKDLYFKLIKEAGFIKKDGSADIKKFNKAAAKVGIDTTDRSASNMQRITKFLNKASGGSYKNVGKFSAKSALENAASQVKDFIGYYAEKYSAGSKKEFWDDAIKLQRKVNKLTISSAEKVKEIARGLKAKWAVPIGITSTLLTKIGFGKALTMAGAHMTPIGYVADVAISAPIIYDAAKEVNEKIIQPKIIEPMAEKMVEGESMLKNLFTPKMRGGGMTDIYEMTKPLGYANGGFEDRMSMLRESMTDTENQRMRQPDIDKIAYELAQQQGDTSEENINLIKNQLQALMPSLTKSMEKELTPMSTQGLKYLFDKMNVATGRKSDPRLNRSVGFGRVE